MRGIAAICVTGHGARMELRGEAPGDVEAISAVIGAAFAGAPRSDGNEAAIVEALRAGGSLALSLVASEDGLIVGHIAFSSVTIDGRDRGWFGLAPLAVAPVRQRRGIGHALVQAGLDRLRATGASGCVVLGEPAYYGRFGFAADPNLHLPGVPPDHFLSLSLSGQRCAGTVQYHRAFLGS